MAAAWPARGLEARQHARLAPEAPCVTSDTAARPNHPIEETAMSNIRLLDPAFGDNLETALRRFFSPSVFEGEAPQLKMRIDVTENDKAYNVKADIPGVKKEDIHVRVDGNLVSIEAQARSEKETRGTGDKVLRSERYEGTVSRSFSLAQDIDAGKVQAKYADGVLTLELPKAAPADSRRITVQ
jgi:HSP20 family protein